MKFIKRVYRFLFFSLVLFLSALSALAKPTGKMVIYREHMIENTPRTYRVSIADTISISMRNNSYFEQNLAVGDYEVKVGRTKNTKILVKVEDGKTVYVKLSFGAGLLAGEPHLSQVDSSSVKVLMYRNGANKIDRKPIRVRHHRVALDACIGGLAKNYKLLNKGGEDLNAIFGGGIGGAISYGYLFRSIPLDLELGVAYFYSYDEVLASSTKGLDAKVDASSRFSRTKFYITPSYVFPIIKGTTNLFLKIGAGLDYYYNPNLEITNGASYKYDSRLGYHARALFELYIADMLSITTGLKWTQSSFKSSSGVSFDGIDTDISKPKGSSLDFQCGLTYYFW